MMIPEELGDIVRNKLLTQWVRDPEDASYCARIALDAVPVGWAKVAEGWIQIDAYIEELPEITGID